MPRHQQDVVEGQRRGQADGDRSASRCPFVFHSAPQKHKGAVSAAQSVSATATHAAAPWHFLYFLPLPQGQGSLRPTFGSSRLTVLTALVAADARRPAAARATAVGSGAGRRGWRRTARPASAAGPLKISGGPARRPDGGPPARPAVFADDRPQPPQITDDLLVDAILHRLEEREALLLVFDERIALAVAAQPDSFLQVVEAVEVILPLRVDDLQHDVALDAMQDRRGRPTFSFSSYLPERQLPDRVAHLLRRHAGEVQRSLAASNAEDLG